MLKIPHHLAGVNKDHMQIPTRQLQRQTGRSFYESILRNVLIFTVKTVTLFLEYYWRLHYSFLNKFMLITTNDASLQQAMTQWQVHHIMWKVLLQFSWDFTFGLLTFVSCTITFIKNKYKYYNYTSTPTPTTTTLYLQTG